MRWGRSTPQRPDVCRPQVQPSHFCRNWALPMPNSSPPSGEQKQRPPKKFGLLKMMATNGPEAIQVVTETAAKVAKAAKRKDSYAKKLRALGVDLQN